MVVRWLIALGPVAWIIAGVAALGAAALLLMVNWESIDARWRQLWDGLKVKAIGVLECHHQQDQLSDTALESHSCSARRTERSGRSILPPSGLRALEAALNVVGGAGFNFGLGTLLKKGSDLLSGQQHS